MSDRITAGFNIYGDSSSSYGLLMLDYEFPTPEIIENEESVPYRSGSYDFTFINDGIPTYADRTVTFVMKAFENNYQERSRYLQELKKWLLYKPKSKFRSEVYEDYIFNLKCTGITYEIKSYGMDITITFKGDPYITHVNTNERVI